jgi:hypothetical protein
MDRAQPGGHAKGYIMYQSQSTAIKFETVLIYCWIPPSFDPYRLQCIETEPNKSPQSPNQWSEAILLATNRVRIIAVCTGLFYEYL